MVTAVVGRIHFHGAVHCFKHYCPAPARLHTSGLNPVAAGRVHGIHRFTGSQTSFTLTERRGMSWLNLSVLVPVDVGVGAVCVIASISLASIAWISGREGDGHYGPVWLRRIYSAIFCAGLLFASAPYVNSTGYLLLVLAAVIAIWLWWGYLGARLKRPR
jgi:hypothetical protein